MYIVTYILKYNSLVSGQTSEIEINKDIMDISPSHVPFFVRVYPLMAKG